MKTQIIDYGMGNLLSVKRAFEACGAQVKVVDDPNQLELGVKTVLPGVGAFGDGMAALNERGFISVLSEIALNKKTPLLGICLGMQMLATKGFEFGEHLGLDFIPGQIVEMKPTEHFHIPHIGWNDVSYMRESVLFKGIPEKSDFYFVHSFCFVEKDSTDVIGKSFHGNEFCSAIEKDNIFGVQFHPEKSQKMGLKLIENFLGL